MKITLNPDESVVKMIKEGLAAKGGYCPCRVEKTEDEGHVLIVSGADLLSGTPILDVKPYLPFTDAHPDARCGFAGAAENYALRVDCPDALLSRVPPEKRDALLACLAQDPRPAYQSDPERLYHMRFGAQEVDFTVRDDLLTVCGIRDCGK